MSLPFRWQCTLSLKTRVFFSLAASSPRSADHNPASAMNRYAVERSHFASEELEHTFLEFKFVGVHIQRNEAQPVCQHFILDSKLGLQQKNSKPSSTLLTAIMELQGST